MRCTRQGSWCLVPELPGTSELFIDEQKNSWRFWLNRLNFPFLFLHLKSVQQLKLCLSDKRWLRSACFSNTFPVSLQTDELFRSSAEGLFFWGCWDADATFSAAYTRPDFSVKGQEGAFYCGGGAGSPTGSSDQQSVQFDRLKFEESFWQ